MDIELRSLGQVKVVKLRGRLNLGEAVDRLRETLDDLMASGDTRILLDLSEVPWIDSSGIGLLVKILTSAKRRGGIDQTAEPFQIYGPDPEDDLACWTCSRSLKISQRLSPHLVSLPGKEQGPACDEIHRP